mgnify:CR=1 FL=1|jgi:hypothetical protein|tara:strand:+ start:524 stop:796 length:273 start_codon:yes stop_codon:yes gene_type:complete
MKEKKEKVYLPSSIKNIETKYGGMIVANFKVDELQANSKNGWVSMVIAERKEPSEKGATHYAYVNDYEPPKDQKTSPKKSNAKVEDDLPF